VADAGALNIGYTIVRLNGSIGEIFTDWLYKNYPDRAQKVINQVSDCHGGQLNDSQWGRRMRGEGNFAQQVADMVRIARQKHIADRQMPKLRYDAFLRMPKKGQYELF
jgi:DNA repair photolyase